MKPLFLSALLLATTSVFAVESQNITVATELLPATPAGGAATVQTTLHNNTDGDRVNVDVDLVLTSSKPATLTATHHPGWPADHWSCTTIAPQHVRCRATRIAAGSFIPLMVKIDPLTAGRYKLTSTATWSEEGRTYTSTPSVVAEVYAREVAVTTAADAGPGSLRGAIEHANDVCTRDGVPCAIRVVTDEPSILLHTPLPRITASDFSIDGRGIELDGSLLAAGNGLEIAGEGPWSVDDLIIGGFPWDGIAVTRIAPADARGAVLRTKIGTRRDGAPNPNRSRGITIHAPARNVFVWSSALQANERSGIFIVGASGIVIDSSLIGRNPFSGSAARGNGASGIFVGPGSSDLVIKGTFVSGNEHWGVSVARGVRGLRIHNSWILGNAALPVDHGLDGFDGYVADRSSFALPAPRIVSSAFDPVTRATVVTGTFDAPDPNLEWEITFVPLSFGLWPEAAFSTARFTGTTFTVTVPGLFSGPYRAYVNSGAPSDWSVSEMSELD